MMLESIMAELQHERGCLRLLWYGDSSHRATVRLWWGQYAGGQGTIYTDITGNPYDNLLASYDNASRVVKYVVIIGQRYGSNTLLDMRIHDINVVADLKWSQRAVTLLDTCHDMDNFECDPDFNWGVVTAGEIVVPPGTEYMTPTGIPSSPAGWHGPNYVHEFENPFILHDLRLFYIQSELIQQYRSLGKMYVALFDVNMNIVLSIHWGDDLIESYRGYFHVVYYPEGGGSAADTTGYIYSSFWRMGELKVENGHITYKIKDLGGTIQSGDLGAVANPFRQVKYLAIRAERYSDYTLIDLRLHAIGLYAGQETSVPEPVEHDGTNEGINNQASQNLADLLLTLALEAVQLFWTGPWPELNFLYEAPSDFPELEARFHVKVDLLQTITVVDFTIAQDMISTITVFWNEIIEKLVEWLILTVWTKISLAAWAVLEKNPEAGLAVLAIALTATFCAFGVPIFYSDILIDSGWEPGWVAAVLFVEAIMMLYVAFGDIIAGYLWMVIAGLAFPSLLFGAYLALVAICQRSFVARFMAFVYMGVYFGLAGLILLQGRVFV